MFAYLTRVVPQQNVNYFTAGRTCYKKIASPLTKEWIQKFALCYTEWTIKLSLTGTWFLSARCAFYSLPCYHKPFLASLLLYLWVSLWLVSWVGLCTMPYCFLKFWKSHVTAVDLFLNKRLCWSLCCFSLDFSHSPLACISCISNQFPCIQNICEH